MSILGIEEITYGADDLATSRQFFSDWGLKLVRESADRLNFECLNGCKVNVADMRNPDLPPAFEDNPTLREVVWGVADEAELGTIAQALKDQPGFVDHMVDGVRRVGCIDPNGMAVRVQRTQKRDIEVETSPMNTWNERERVNKPSPVYERATPIEVGHVVFFVSDVEATERFYAEKLRPACHWALRTRFSGNPGREC